MATFKAAEWRAIDQVLDMGAGGVLDFSHRTIGEFFLDELNIEFHDAKYVVDNGTSKAKRLRAFLRMVDDATAIRTLRALLDYRTALYKTTTNADPTPNAAGMLLEVIHRLDGSASSAIGGRHVPPPASAPVPVETLKNELMALARLAPQPRGYAFEKFLISLFKAYGLQPNSPFRLVGEQIDGSFKHDGEFYLLEAKWQDPKTPAADLHVFEGKLQQKAMWARGLFVSNSGFTDEGLQAYGRSEKRLVCMDGFDIWTMLDNRLPLPEVLDRKLRWAAERGEVFRSVRDLF